MSLRKRNEYRLMVLAIGYLGNTSNNYPILAAAGIGRASLQYEPLIFAKSPVAAFSKAAAIEFYFSF
jgi:hypothetical protein